MRADDRQRMTEATSDPALPPALREAIETVGTDPARAREIARGELGQDDPDPRYWVIAGQASRVLEDWRGLEQAADGLLEVAPNAILGLVWKGDCFSRRGEPRGATPYYRAALRAAANAGPLPEATQRDLERVRQEVEAIGQNYVGHLEERLRTAGFGRDDRPERFSKALEILLGQRPAEMTKQRPKVLFYPDLPQRNFYDREDFDWAERLERETEVIREELRGVLDEPTNFKPYVTGEPGGPGRDYHGMQDNPEWTSYYLWADGAPVEDHVRDCPRTAELLSTLPQPSFPNRSPTAMFSRLIPGAHIPPHNGMLNCRLICHLPLIVPPGCGFKVDGERRDWEEGKLVIFDDSIEHEAWNEGDEDRVVLLFDIARPEITENENRAIAALFDAVDSYV